MAGLQTAAHSLHSSHREALLEHLFVGELLKVLWRAGHVLAEIMKPQVDNGGYDLVIECNGVTRHIQLKSSFHGAITSQQNVHINLTEKPSGCVVWMIFDPQDLRMLEFLFFGGAPGQPLPSLEVFKQARHTKGNAQGFKAVRERIRVIPKRNFRSMKSMEQLIAHLFGVHI